MTIEIKEALDRELSWYQAYKNLAEQKLEEINKQIIFLQRQQWWLEHPSVAYFTGHTYWEIDRWSRESYLELSVRQAVDINGLEIQLHELEPLFFYGFEALATEVRDDDELTIYRNPYAVI